MTDPASLAPRLTRPTDWTAKAMQARIARRYAAERRFRLMGLAALVIAAAFLLFLLSSIISKGWTGFLTTEIRLTVTFDPDVIGVTAADLTGPDASINLERADTGLVAAIALEKLFPQVSDGEARERLDGLLSASASAAVNRLLRADPTLIGKRITLWLPASSDVDQWRKGRIDASADENTRPLSDDQIGWAKALAERGLLRATFNTGFLTGADSTDAEVAAVWGAAKGSFLTLIITLLISFPIGVLAAVYLEEFAPRNRLTDFIEVNINNLAAVPSIIFGLLGLAVFLNSFHMPRSAPLVGGLTLALMTLPVVVIAARSALKAVPPSIKDAALAMGASKMQTIFHHLLPLALPGILTGSIIGMARALGETAPLLMIGMRAFIVDAPHGFTDPATVLPVQIFLWSDEVDAGFVEKTSAAIIVLLIFLLMMNGLAIYLRNKFERRW